MNREELVAEIAKVAKVSKKEAGEVYLQQSILSKIQLKKVARLLL